MDQANVLIIGGGVVGCAIARAVSARWEDVFLVEQNPKLGMATSSRNSGVIHSGIYYPKNSLKARHCVEGNRLTYEFCKKHSVPFRHTGKLVVAADAQEEPALEALKKKGEDNGVEGLRLIGPEEIRKREPHIRGSAAMVVPSTGIVSAEELVHAFARVAAGQGAEIVNHARVVSLKPVAGAVRIGLRIGDGRWLACPMDAVTSHTFRLDDGLTAVVGVEKLKNGGREVRVRSNVVLENLTDHPVVLHLEPREIVVPADLAEALAHDHTAQANFDGLSYTHRKEWVRWIEEAKKAETRATRLAKTVESLHAGKRAR